MKAAWRRPAILLALIAVAIILAQLTLRSAWSGDALRRFVEEGGPWGPFVYVVIYVLAALLLLPGLPVTLMAGILFGPIYGILWAWIGGNAGALAAYAVGRSGSGPVRRFLHARLERFSRFFDAHSFGSVLTLRLVPLVPFNLLNYALGFADVEARAYVPATLLGVIPGTTAYVLFGVALGNLDRFREPAFYLPLLGAILLTLIASIVSVRLQRRVPPARAA